MEDEGPKFGHWFYKMIKHIQLFDLLGILKIAHQGVRRASIFMGLGVNAAIDPTFLKYELTNIANLQFVPSGLDTNTINDFKTEFWRWVIGCGLRELTETFAFFLDQTHLACMNMELIFKKKDRSDPEKIQRVFEGKGWSEKLDFLESSYDVKPKHSDFLKTINKLRNCLTHRLGMVTKRDCNNNDELIIKWVGMDFFFRKDGGERKPIPSPTTNGVILNGPGQIEVQFLEKSKAFKINTFIDLSPNELAEICKSFLDSSSEIHDSTTRYADKLGIKKAE